MCVFFFGCRMPGDNPFYSNIDSMPDIRPRRKSIPLVSELVRYSPSFLLLSLLFFNILRTKKKNKDNNRRDRERQQRGGWGGGGRTKKNLSIIIITRHTTSCKQQQQQQQQQQQHRRSRGGWGYCLSWKSYHDNRSAETSLLLLRAVCILSSRSPLGAGGNRTSRGTHSLMHSSFFFFFVFFFFFFFF